MAIFVRILGKQQLPTFAKLDTIVITLNSQEILDLLQGQQMTLDNALLVAIVKLVPFNLHHALLELIVQQRCWSQFSNVFHAQLEKYALSSG